MLAHTIAVLAQEANEQTTDTILWIIAAVLVIAGIFAGRPRRGQPAGLAARSER